tara:strand:+ start:321 stop:689 length:369 start_codon:yes stop_codon:yes gene_type:complete
MSDAIGEVEIAMAEEPSSDADLKPKPPSKLAPQGIRTFTVYRRSDETGVSGEGIVIEGVILATGHCIVHWLYPPPRGGIAIFDSMTDFIKVHIKPHPTNKTIITYEDGEQRTFGDDPEKEQE